MKGFIEHIQKSIYGPEYYRELLPRPASFSWKYYVSLTMSLALLLTIISSIPLVPAITSALRELPQNVLTYYPDELEITVAAGHVSTNIAEPYYFPLPESLKGFLPSKSESNYLGVIDTHTAPSLSQFEAYRSLFWLTEREIMLQEESKVSAWPIHKDTNFVLTEQELRTLLDRLQPYFKFVAPAVVVAIFFAMLLVFSLNLFYLLFAALFVLLLGKVQKRGWNYGTSYRLSLHATTLPLLISSAFSLVGLSDTGIPFLSTLLLLLVVYMNFKQPNVVAPENPSTEPPTPQEPV